MKANIKQKSELALAGHIAAISRTLGKVTLPDVVSEFAGAMKNKRTIASLQDAVDTELARAKIDANQAADSIRLNLTSLAELAIDYVSLLNDVLQLVTRTNDDLVTLIKFRISEHQKGAQEKADAKRMAEEQEAQRLAAITLEPIVEKLVGPEPVRATPVQTSAPVGRAEKPVASHNVDRTTILKRRKPPISRAACNALRKLAESL
ncbi:hypothetical protein [Pseudomonas orientalis]|uniref:hypothetical protein n=1 Tax=Pseudomonas orientalis TaxID=76758 RepID=UPI001F14E63B